MNETAPRQIQEQKKISENQSLFLVINDKRDTESLKYKFSFFLVEYQYRQNT